MASSSSLKDWLSSNRVSNSKYVLSKLEGKKITLDQLLNSDEKQVKDLLGPNGARLPSTYSLLVIKAIKKTPGSQICSTSSKSSKSKSKSTITKTTPQSPPTTKLTKSIKSSPTKSSNTAKSLTNNSNTAGEQSNIQTSASSSVPSKVTNTHLHDSNTAGEGIHLDSTDQVKDESQLLNILKENYDDISNAVTTTQESIQAVKKNIQTIENDINIEFERIINILNEKRSSLLSQLSKIKNKELETLDNQYNTLKSSRDALSQTKKEFLALSNLSKDSKTSENGSNDDNLSKMNEIVSNSIQSLHSNVNQLNLVSDCQILIQTKQSNTNSNIPSSVTSIGSGVNSLNMRNIMENSNTFGPIAASVASDETLSLVTSPPSEHSSVGNSNNNNINNIISNDEPIESIETFFNPISSTIDSLQIEYYCNKLDTYSNFMQPNKSYDIGNDNNNSGEYVSHIHSNSRKSFDKTAADELDSGNNINIINTPNINNDDEKERESHEIALHKGLESLQLSYKLNEVDRALLDSVGGSYLSHFDPKSSSHNIKLSNENTVVTKLGRGVSGEYVCLDMNPITTGIHCFRIHHRDNSNITWSLIPFSKKGMSYDRAKGYGINNYNQLFRFGKLQHNLKKQSIKTDVWKGKLIDILIDLNNSLIKFRCPEFDVNMFDAGSIRSGMSGMSGMSGIDENNEDNDMDNISEIDGNESNEARSEISKGSRGSKTSRTSKTSMTSGHSYHGQIDGKGDKKFRPSISLKSTIEFEKNVEKKIEKAKNEINEVVIKKLPSNQKWILHFTLYKENAEIKVRKIPKEWYGKYVEKVNFMV